MKNYIDFKPNGKNRTPDVVHALINAQDGTTLRFEKGVYDFFSDGAYRDFFMVTCNRSSNKKVIFPMLNLNDITIDGGGAQFIFHERVFPFIARKCNGVTLKNFSIDFSFPRCLEAEVAEINDDGFMLAIDSNIYDYDANDDGNLIIRAGGTVFSTCERRVFINQNHGNSVFYILAGKTYAHYSNPAAPILTCRAEKCTGGIYFRYEDSCDFHPRLNLGKVLMLYDEMRENDVMFFDNDRNPKIKNVTIYRGGGMGVVGQCCENMSIDGLTITPHGDEVYSTTADGILLSNFSGTVTVENCHLDRTIDDAMNIHGFYVRVEKIIAPNKVVTTLCDTSSIGVNYFFPGDRVCTTDSDGANETGHVVVRDAYMWDDISRIYLEFEEDISELLHPGDYIENPDRTPETYIRNNSFSNFPNLRLASAKKTVFENNTVKNCGQVMMDDIMAYWHASGRVHDVEIKNNVFENIVGLAAFLDRPEGNARHENIRITDNIFRNCDCAIDAERVDGLVFRRNRFENVKRISNIRNCTDVDIDEEN